MAGWIKTHRAVQSHWIFADAEKYRAWMIILFTVNFEPKKVNIKNSVFECKRGESLLSLDSWADKFGKNWNKSKVRRFFKLLESDSMIVLKSEHKTTRLTVCNYETYQDERNGDETQTKRKRNANETQTTPTKEGKEVKNEKELITPDNSIIEKLNSFDPKILNICKWFIDQLDEKAKARISNKNKLAWCETIEKCNRIDGFSFERIMEIVKFAKLDSFWNPNFMSLRKLREKKQGEDLTFIFRWDAKLKAPKIQGKETYEQTVSRTCVNQRQEW